MHRDAINCRQESEKGEGYEEAATQRHSTEGGWLRTGFDGRDDGGRMAASLVDGGRWTAG